MLSFPREMTVLSQTGLTLVVVKGEGDSPVRAIGALLCHLPFICRHTVLDRAQIWRLGVTQKNYEDGAIVSLLPEQSESKKEERFAVRARHVFTAARKSTTCVRSGPSAGSGPSSCQGGLLRERADLIVRLEMKSCKQSARQRPARDDRDQSLGLQLRLEALRGAVTADNKRAEKSEECLPPKYCPD